MTTSARRLLALVLLIPLAGTAVAPGATQTSERTVDRIEPQLQPLPESDRASAETAPTGEVARLLAEAREIFYSPRQPEAIPLLSEILFRLAAAAGDEADSQRPLLIEALALRAEARFNLGEIDGAEQDLWLLLQQDAGFALDTEKVSPKFSALLEELRARTVGRVELRVTPADARISLGGRTFSAASGIVAVLAGSYQALIERAGHEPRAVDLEVRAGELASLAADLERTSATIAMTTRPAGVEVEVDGKLRGVTEPDEDGDSAAGTAGSVGRLVLDRLGVGSHEVLFRKDGYRPAVMTINVAFFSDFTLELVELEPTRGTLRVRGLAPGAILSINGAPFPLGTEQAEITLPPGEHLVEARLGTLGRFSRQLTIVDRQETALEIEMRPTLTLVAVGASDAFFAAQLGTQIAGRLRRSTRWLYLDEPETGSRVLAGLGVGPGDLAEALAGSTPVDWRTARLEFDQRIGASLYVFATARDQATEPELWLWTTEPEVTAPRRWMPLGAERGTLEELAEALDRSLGVQAPFVGARFIDSAASGGTVVADVVAGGPAAVAGLAPGDVVRTVSGRAVTGGRDLVAGLPIGEVELMVARDGSTHRVTAVTQAAPAMPWPNRIAPEALIRRTRLRLALAGGTGVVDPWVLRLNLAALLLGEQRWDAAARLLQAIEAPPGAGIGKGTVDYWLGVALAAAESDSASAQPALERAATAPGATLAFRDGPLVAPRALLRLETLAD